MSYYDYEQDWEEKDNCQRAFQAGYIAAKHDYEYISRLTMACWFLGGIIFSALITVLMIQGGR